MQIEIIVKDVYTCAIALTSIAGKGADNYPLVAATEDNQEILQLYLSQAVSEAEGALREHLSASRTFSLTLTASVITLELKDHLRADEGIRNMIESSLRLYAIQAVTALWLANTPAREAAEPHRKSAEGYMLTILDALDQRERFVLEEDDFTAREGESESDARDVTAVYEGKRKDSEEISEDNATPIPYELREEEFADLVPDDPPATYERRSREASRLETVDTSSFATRRHHGTEVGTSGKEGGIGSSVRQTEGEQTNALADGMYSRRIAEPDNDADDAASGVDYEAPLKDNIPTHRRHRHPRPDRLRPLPDVSDFIPADYGYQHSDNS
jgi:hypothetical protein